jgi:carbon storage regulator
MLVLSRRRNESVVINNDVTITVVEIRDDRVRLGIVAPRDVPVHRHEVYEAIHGHDAIRDFSIAPVAEEISEMIIVEARLDKGGKIRFTSEGGFAVE